ncbi:DUF957 domain-containing protein [Citrobacter freundii]|uniref:DUF957 domain-containing protein n=1 Tax=Citrobacter TaxID=544 RepID=UPI000F4D9C42|nr:MULTISPECIES: DUF957 domain-containing protein [Citrobacter]HED2482374.1 DUF957 domain-containing protein [Citrobacter youngae]AYY47151.1 hypothetical protein EGX89_00535 [Citrobacter freundii]MBJ9559492.1 DUF957 domain-containing protein [Citrobacter sp. FDAARGOS_156]MCT1497367.1 DUF957 domain-containing protein [Citrobacter freundii]MDU7352031.1 DUF957 domain-containing protein [Citrobacter freundii]
MSKPHKLEILLAWLEDNVAMGTEIIFDEGIDSGDVLPSVRAAVELLNMPKAVSHPPPWDAYYTCEAIDSEELSKDEARVWNMAQKYVQDTLQGRAVNPDGSHHRSSH